MQRVSIARPEHGSTTVKITNYSFNTSAQVGLGMKADNSYNLIYIDLSVEVSRVNNVQSQNLI